MSTLLLALLSICLSVAAQFLLKSGMSGSPIKELLAGPMGLRTAIAIMSNVSVLCGFALYGLGAVAWLGVLSRWDVSKAYPLVGLGFALALVAGWIMGEQVTLYRLAGVALMCAGIWIVART